jgi:hypothetical protein
MLFITLTGSLALRTTLDCILPGVYVRENGMVGWDELRELEHNWRCERRETVVWMAKREIGPW